MTKPDDNQPPPWLREPSQGDGWAESKQRDWTEFNKGVQDLARWLMHPAMTRADALALALVLYAFHGAFHMRVPYAISLGLVGAAYVIVQKIWSKHADRPDQPDPRKGK